MLVAALALSFLDVNMDLPNVLSSITQVFSSTEDERFTFDSGIYGSVYAGGELKEEDDHLVLTKGSALLASRGVFRTEIDSVSVVSMNGSLHITRGTKSVIVAALTAPAVILSGDQRMIVPTGMQWEIEDSMATLNDGFDLWMKSRLPRPLPMSFIERKLGDLSLVRLPESILPQSRQLLPLDIVPQDQLLLQVSESHVTADRNEHILGVIRTVTEDRDADRLEELLNAPVVAEALATDRGRVTVSALLAQTDDADTILRMLLLQQLIQEEAVWLVASFHPAYRDIAWAIFEPDVSTESYLARVFLLPFSTFSPESFSDFVLERFAVSLRGMLGKVGDPDAFADHIVQAHMPLVDRLEDRGYPQRAKHISETLLGLIGDTENPTQDMQMAEDILNQRTRVDLSPLPPKTEKAPQPETDSEVVPVKEPEPVVTLSPLQLEDKAYQLLEEQGAFFTVNKSIAWYKDNLVLVTDILFSTPTEDRSVSFTLDVVTKIVTEIEINGDTDFPYSPSLEGFVNWVKK
jgi:hypothetical protein